MENQEMNVRIFHKAALKINKKIMSKIQRQKYLIAAQYVIDQLKEKEG